MKKYAKLLLLSLLMFALVGCGKVPVLKNGEEALVTSKQGDISVNDFYNLLKDKYGTDSIIDMIDEVLFSKLYKEDDDEKTEIATAIESYKKEAENSEVSWTYYLNYYGFNNESELKDMLVVNYRRSKAVEDLLKDELTDKEIDKHYTNEIYGDIKCKHILITPEVLDGMTDKEKEAKEKEALNTAKDLIKKLNDGAKFEDLAKEYSDDEGSASKEGDLGWFNTGEMLKEFETAAFALKKGKYTTTPVKSQYGYHIILKVDEKAKPKLKDVKEDIKETLVKNKLEADTTLYYKTLEKVRSNNGIEIHDDELNKSYKNKMKELTNK